MRTPKRVFHLAEHYPAAEAGDWPGKAARKTRQELRPLSERSCDSVDILSVKQAHFEVQLGDLTDQKLVESQRPLEHRSFSSHPMSGGFIPFHIGETEAQGGHQHGLSEHAELSGAWLSHPALGWASNRGGQGKRKFLRLLGVKVRLPSRHPALPQPQKPRFLR